jgi:hypothetical protein
MTADLMKVVMKLVKVDPLRLCGYARGSKTETRHPVYDDTDVWRPGDVRRCLK